MNNTITLETIQARQDELVAMIAAFNAAKKTINLPAATIELRPGESYASLVLKDDGTPSHHLVLMAERPDRRLTWEDANDWASKIGGALPTQREASLIFAHCSAYVERDWHWSSEPHENGDHGAWACNFSCGNQNATFDHVEFFAVAVRRIPIEGV